MPKLFEQFSQYSLIYFSGIYWWFKNPRVVSSRVNKVRDHLTALKEDAFVAVHIDGYNKVPMLRKVRSLDTSTFKLLERNMENRVETGENYQTEISGQTLYLNRVSSWWISC